MAKTLTQVAAENLKAGPGRREIRDGGSTSLFLVIQPSGHKSWALRFRKPNGNPAKLTLGPFCKAEGPSDRKAEGEPAIGHKLTVVRARRLAAAINDQRAVGLDVVAEHKAEKHRRDAERDIRAAHTFQGAAQRFVAEYRNKKTGRTPRRLRETARLLGLDHPAGIVIKGGLADRWQDKPIADITESDLFIVIDETRSKGVPGTQARNKGPSEPRARSMHSALSVLFGWLKYKRLIAVDPSIGLDAPGAPQARDRVLTNAEIVSFWAAASAERKEFSSFLKLLLLTGCRLNEVAGMRRSELSDDGLTWTIPGERTKNHRPHVVPLAPLVRDLLKGLTQDEGTLVFTTNGSTQISGFSKLKKRLDAAMEIPGWRLHDVRRVAATGMADIGIFPHIVEACLNYVSGSRGGVAGVYNHASYATEKRAALERWADHVAGLIAGREAKVIDMKSAKKA